MSAKGACLLNGEPIRTSACASLAKPGFRHRPVPVSCAEGRLHSLRGAVRVTATATMPMAMPASPPERSPRRGVMPQPHDYQPRAGHPAPGGVIGIARRRGSSKAVVAAATSILFDQRWSAH